MRYHAFGWSVIHDFIPYFHSKLQNLTKLKLWKLSSNQMIDSTTHVCTRSSLVRMREDSKLHKSTYDWWRIGDLILILHVSSRTSQIGPKIFQCEARTSFKLSDSLTLQFVVFWPEVEAGNLQCFANPILHVIKSAFQTVLQALQHLCQTGLDVGAACECDCLCQVLLRLEVCFKFQHTGRWPPGKIVGIMEVQLIWV